MKSRKQFHGDHFAMYRNIESLCCAPETNSVVGQLYFKNKQTENSEKKRSELWLPGGEVGGGRIR